MTWDWWPALGANSMCTVCHGWKTSGAKSVFFTLVVACVVLPCAGQATTSISHVKNQEAARKLATAWEAYWHNQFGSCLHKTNRLGKSEQAVVKIHAMHLHARALWAIGDPGSRRAAQSGWSRLSRVGRGHSIAKAYMQIGHSLNIAAKGRREKAIGVLTDLARIEMASIVTAEARIEAALLLAEAGQSEQAHEQLDQAAWFLDNAQSNDLPPALAKTFIKAVTQVRTLVDSPGLREYRTASGLLKEGRHRAAMLVFKQLAERYPDSEYGIRSELAMGHCWLGLLKPRKAEEHWQQMIARAPAGPWRGQAYVALIDLYLEQLGSLSLASEYVVSAATAHEQANIDERATASWKLAQYDLYWRRILVHMVQNQHEMAVSTIQLAKTSFKSKDREDALNCLLDIARAGDRLIPEDVSTGCKKATLALSMGMIYLIIGQENRAYTMFERVAGTAGVGVNPPSRAAQSSELQPPLDSASVCQRSFAIFANGLRLGHSHPQAMMKQLKRSMALWPHGSWHDESIFHLAMYAQKTKHAQPTRASKQSPANARKQSRQLESETVGRKPAANKQLLVAIRARSSAVPLWQDLLAKYAESGRCEYAYYHLGVLHADLAHAGVDERGNTLNGARLALMQSKSIQMLTALCERFPNSHMAGDAYVRRLDIGLNAKLDLAGAQSVAQKAVQWAKSSQPQASSQGSKLAVWQRLGPYAKPTKRSTSDVQACYFRAAIVAYLSGDTKRFSVHARKAGPAKQNKQAAASASLQAMGLRVLLSRVEADIPVTHPHALELASDDRQRVAIQLADLYIASERTMDALAMLTRLLEGNEVVSAVKGQLVSYLRFRLGYALLRVDTAQAIEQFQQLYQPACREAPWTAEGILYLGILTFNTTQDPAKALPHYEHIVKTYPDHPVACRALYFSCLNANRLGQTKKLASYAQTFLDMYPGHRWHGEIKELLARQPQAKD